MPTDVGKRKGFEPMLDRLLVIALALGVFGCAGQDDGIEEAVPTS